ncbi:MAG TPA: helix-turn-helix domain-containing protein [Trinickia sp.]|nr:helix-turn-helix domain-containing protein [Trinickia sp.]
MAAALEKYLIDHQLVFDSNLMTLSHGDVVTALAANETELLLLLMQGIATKQAVIEQVWESKGMVVTEGSYHQLVRSLRLKLEEQGVSSGLIKTLPRLGLKFLGTVEPIVEAPVPATVPPSAERTAHAEAAGASGVDEADGVAADASAPQAQPPLSDAGGEATAAVPEPEPSVALSAATAACVAADVEIVPSGGPQAKKRSKAWMYAVYGVLIAWAGVLAWKTFFEGERMFEFPFAQTIDGVHYFSNGKLEQQALLQSIHVTPARGSYVYQIGLGNNDWLAVCPKSIYEAPEQCETYFVEKAYH